MNYFGFEEATIIDLMIKQFCPDSERDIKNNAWVTVNNDFWVTSDAISNDFHEWRSHERKSLANRITRSSVLS